MKERLVASAKSDSFSVQQRVVHEQANTLTKAMESRPWFAILLVLFCYLVVTLLSAGQIYFKLSHENANPAWWHLVWTNLIAWGPWPLITPYISRYWARFSPLQTQPVAHIAFHLIASTITAIAYLLYLTSFRFVFFGSYTGPLTIQSFSETLAAEIGQFFLVAWALYWVIGIASQVVSNHGRSKSVLIADEKTLGDNQPTEAAVEGPHRFLIRSLGRTQWVQVDEIEWIEADRSYVILHTVEKCHAYRETMNRLAQELAMSGFVRIHRSVIVNLSRISELLPGSHGDAQVRLKTGKMLRVSRTYRQGLEQGLLHSK